MCNVHSFKERDSLQCVERSLLPKEQISLHAHAHLLRWFHGKQQQLASLRQVRNVLYKRKQHGGFVILIMIFGKLRMFPTVVRIRVLAKFGSRALYFERREILRILLNEYFS